MQKIYRLFSAVFALLASTLLFSTSEPFVTLNFQPYQPPAPSNVYASVQAHQNPYNNNTYAISTVGDMFNNPTRCADWEVADYTAAVIYFYGREYNGAWGVDDVGLQRVMHQWPLYNYPAFWKFIQQFSAFGYYIPALCKILQDNPQLKKQLSKKAVATFDLAHERWLEYHESQRRELQPQKCKELLNGYHAVCKEQYKQGVGSNDRITKRIHAAQQGLAASSNYYALSSEAQKLLQEYGYAYKPYTHCIGNPLQQVVHAEYTEIIQEAAHIEPELVAAVPLILRCTDQGATYNKKGSMMQALMCSDFAHGIVQCAKSIGKGVAHGAWNAYKTIEQPWETARDIIHACVTVTKTLAYYNQRLREAEIQYLIGNVQPVQNLMEDTHICIGQLWEQCKKTPYHVYIEGGVAFVVEGFLSGKLTHAASAKLLQSTAELKSLIKAESTVEHVVTTDGKLIKVAAAAKEEEIPARVAAQATVTEAEKSFAKAAMGKNPLSSKQTIVTKNVSPSVIQEFAARKECMIIPAVLAEGEQKVEFLEDIFKHIYQLTQVKVISASGKVELRIIGFHHDYLWEGLKAGFYELRNVVTHPNGVVEGWVVIEGQEFYKTFFPPDWSRENVFEVIKEALRNPIKDVVLKNKRIQRIAKVNQVDVIIIFEADGKTLVSAYPYIKNPQKL